MLRLLMVFIIISIPVTAVADYIWLKAQFIEYGDKRYESKGGVKVHCEAAWKEGDEIIILDENGSTMRFPIETVDLEKTLRNGKSLTKTPEIEAKINEYKKDMQPTAQQYQEDPYQNKQSELREIKKTNDIEKYLFYALLAIATIFGIIKVAKVNIKNKRSTKEAENKKTFSNEPSTNIQSPSQVVMTEQIQDEQAQAVYAHAMMLMNIGVSDQEIYKYLIEQEFDAEAASLVVSNLAEIREKQKRVQGKKSMLFGALWCIGGTVVTVATYISAASEGGTYVITYGAIVIGAIQFFQGLFHYVTTKSPSNLAKKTAEPCTKKVLTVNTRDHLETISFSCPGCGLGGSIPKEKVPAGGINANCPKCKVKFRVS
jgi:hypothetical protein